MSDKKEQAKSTAMKSNELSDEMLAAVSGGAMESPNQKASVGVTMNRIDYTSNNLTTSSENLQSAESTYRDADMAKEMTEFTKNNILMQTATAMQSQANQQNQGVLSLLQ